MPKCLIDGKEVEFKPGENMIEVAKRADTEIPVFCYHPGLAVVAQCRMCYVEVGTPGKDGKIAMLPKLQTACSTPITDGMVIQTNTEKVQKGRKATMEFLLINHPLDCPICDKSGECDLQDNSYKHGDAYMRTTEERRTYVDLDMGPVIKKNMNRCIHCTRCIRFGDQIAGIREMVAIQRGNNTEITTIDGLPLQTQYAGNYADICPTGSLTLKDFRFKKRVWFLKKTPTICEGCSRGCNMEIHEHHNQIERCVPRENLEVNKYWMCDEGRFNYHYVQDDKRITRPKDGDWKGAIVQARESLKGKKPTILVGSDLTQEEAKLIQDVMPKVLPGAQLYHFGTPGINSVADDADEDKILRRKSKTANLHGLEKLGYKGFDGATFGDAVIVIRGGKAALPPSLAKQKNVIGVGVFTQEESQNFATILPGITFAEKDGTVVNSQGMEQRFRRALTPPQGCKSLSEIMMMWVNQ